MSRTNTWKQEHPESANLCQCQNFNQKWPGIQIQIFGLIQIRMSVGSVPKCYGCIILSASVISPSTVQIGRWLYEKCNKCPKNPQFHANAESEKVIWNPQTDQITTDSLSLLEGHPLPLLAKFGRCLFPHSSEWQNDHIISALLAEITMLDKTQLNHRDKWHILHWKSIIKAGRKWQLFTKPNSRVLK